MHTVVPHNVQLEGEQVEPETSQGDLYSPKAFFQQSF